MNKLFLNTAIDRSRKFHILKLKTVLGKILTLDKESYFENSTQNYFSFLCKIKATDLIEYGTDFFWSVVHRLSNALDKNNQDEIEKTYIYFLLNSFDSFFSLLPIESQLQFKGIGNNDVILPKLGISLGCYLDNSSILCKVSDTSLTYKINKFDSIPNNNYLIPLNEIPQWFKLKQEIVCERISIISQKHECIFEEHYYKDCCENVFLSHLLKCRIDKAFDIIKSNDIELYNKLVSSIEYIIPYGNDIEKKYPNFAIATLKKTIFLSIDLLSESDIHVAECIIHEYSHCELHCVQDTVLLTNIENNILEYYSPWRKDPRPLLGLVHAIYIGNEILAFYFKYLQNGKNQLEEKAVVTAKVEIIIHQIIIAIRQIKKHQLTDFTLGLMNSILKSTHEVSEHLSISTFSLPEEVVKHIESWKLTNPNSVIIEKEFNHYKSSADFYDLDFTKTHYDDVEFYLDLVKQHGNEVLELCCGTGRITIPIAKNNISITAIDISKEMLSIFRQKLKQEQEEVSSRISIIESDMTNFSLDKKFNCILIPFHSFQALTDTSQISQALKTIFHHLTDEGVFILNLFRPLDNMKEIEGVCESKIVTNDKGEILYKKNCINTFVDVLQQIIYYELQYFPVNNGIEGKPITENLKAKYYQVDQIKDILQQHNFKIETEYYGFKNNSLEKTNSSELTLICKKTFYDNFN